MTEKQRNRILAKQDDLLDLIDNHIEPGRFPEEYRLTCHDETSPTIAEMRTMIFPEWESTIDKIILSLKGH